MVTTAIANATPPTLAPGNGTITPLPTARARRHRQTKDHLVETPHPAWMEEMLAAQQPVWDRATKGEFFRLTVEDEFPEQMWRAAILEFWCVIEAFPKYMGLTLAKTTFGKSSRDYLARDWLIGNIRIESMHAGWYIDWARAHDIPESTLLAHRPGPAVAALHEWLFSIAHRGSLAQAVGAINYAIEGTAGVWTKLVYNVFERRYQGMPDAARAMAWLKAHAKYDDHHPIEALEIVKLAARPDEYDDVGSGVLRSLELLTRGFDWIYENGR